MTLLAERAGLLADIFANPEDDTPRLVFADLLEESGGEKECGWAKFIRVGCQRGKKRCSNCGSSGDLCELCRPAWEAEFETWRWGCHLAPGNVLPRCNRRKLEDRVLQCPVPVEGKLSRPSVVYRRGFPDELHCPLAYWLRHGPALVRVHPLRGVQWFDAPPYQSTAQQADGNNWLLHDALSERARLPKRLETAYRVLLKPIWEWYPSAEAVREVISARCLEWAKGVQP